MILIVDNTFNLSKAFMTPKIINFLIKNNIKYYLVKTLNELENNNLKNLNGIILTGGPLLLSKRIDISLINVNILVMLNYPNVPLLGICFGSQLIASFYGNNIKTLNEKKEGYVNIKINNKKSKILNNIDEKTLLVFKSHKDYFTELSNDFNILMYEENIIQGFEHKYKPIWGFQFHPEALNNTNKIIENFINICYKQI